MSIELPLITGTEVELLFRDEGLEVGMFQDLSLALPELELPRPELSELSRAELSISTG